jgi:ABC-type Mn2+/Zn2+ transport system ATPase subunit
MLELRRVTKHFAGIPAVDDVSFTARPGEVTGYLGPNGSGKSTTMKMITGLIERTYGQILFNGQAIEDDLVAYSPWLRNCAISRPARLPSASTACFGCFRYSMTGMHPSPASSIRFRLKSGKH